MSMNETHYERIARWLDGQDVTLSAAERAVADEIRRGEEMLASLAGGDWPRKAHDRASRRMAAELARPRRLWIGRSVAAAAVAAAIITIALMLPTGPVAPPKPTGNGTGTPLMADVSIETLIEEMEESVRPGVVVELLAGELESIEVDMLVTAEVGEAEFEIGVMEDEFESILLDPAAPWSFNGGV